MSGLVYVTAGDKDAAMAEHEALKNMDTDRAKKLIKTIEGIMKRR